MKFLKMFFDDDNSKIGLCGFDSLTPKYSTTPIEDNFFFNPFEAQQLFKTDFSRNKLLIQ